MFSLKRTMNCKILLLILLSFSCVGNLAIAQNAQGFQLRDKILEISRVHINVGDMFFKLSPTVKVKLSGNKNGRISDLKVGDYVGIKLITYNGRKVVDSIHYLPGTVNLPLKNNAN